MRGLRDAFEHRTTVANIKLELSATEPVGNPKIMQSNFVFLTLISLTGLHRHSNLQNNVRLLGLRLRRPNLNNGKVTLAMGKKNSGPTEGSSSRGSKRGRGSGRGGFKGNVGYKGRDKDISGRGGVIDGRPDSAVDIVSEEDGEEDEEGSSGIQFSFFLLKVDLNPWTDDEEDTRIEVPVAMWVR